MRIENEDGKGLNYSLVQVPDPEKGVSWEQYEASAEP